MNTEVTGSHTYKECHKTESPWNHTSTAHKERDQLGDRRTDGDSICNSGDGTGQMAQPWMFMMMMMINLMPRMAMGWFLLRACNMAAPPHLIFLGRLVYWVVLSLYLDV
jgi:hypothetical protein